MVTLNFQGLSMRMLFLEFVLNNLQLGSFNVGFIWSCLEEFMLLFNGCMHTTCFWLVSISKVHYCFMLLSNPQNVCTFFREGNERRKCDCKCVISWHYCSYGENWPLQQSTVPSCSWRVCFSKHSSPSGPHTTGRHKECFLWSFNLPSPFKCPAFSRLWCLFMMAIGGCFVFNLAAGYNQLYLFAQLHFVSILLSHYWFS